MNTLQFQNRLLGLQDNMMSFALLLTSNPDEAQDLLQDTTLKVLDNQDKYIDNSNFKGWVMTVMRNIFINNYHRAIRTQGIIDQGIDVYNIDNTYDSGLDSPAGSLDIREMTDAINSLTDEMKIPFSMHLSGYKYDEIANAMDLPLGTIKSRIFFARQELQKRLKDFYQA